MLPLPLIRENTEEIKSRLSKRNIDANAMIDEVLELDKQRRQLQSEADNKLSESNQLAKEIGSLFREGKREEAEEKKNLTTALKEEIRILQNKQEEVDEKLHKLLVLIPNAPHESVPAGKTPEDNEVVRTGGKQPELSSDAMPHWELASKYDIIDFELGVKITGAGFPVYKGKGAKLQRALIQFFLDSASEAGYLEVQPPYMVNEASGFGTGQLPDKEGQMYHMEKDNLYMIPTAEVPVTNFFRDEIIDEANLPVKCTAYTPCFRREAGSYGKDVRGLNRLHQFDKVEIVQVAHPDKSYETLEQMVSYVESLLQKLELPYRVLRLCGGDMGFTSALTYDMEVWSAAQQRWLEVSSISNFESYQANRLKLRYRDKDRKTQLAHTLNGSALALPRIVASLLENNQTAEGINIPEVLRRYTGFDVIK